MRSEPNPRLWRRWSRWKCCTLNRMSVQSVAGIHRGAQSHIGHHWVPQAVHGRPLRCPARHQQHQSTGQLSLDEAVAACHWLDDGLLQEWGLRFVREYRVSTYFGEGIRMDIVTDASPWGIGGYLVIADKILSYFSCPLTAEVERVLQMKIGESSSQQVAEALAVLVALRGWEKIRSRWNNRSGCRWRATASARSCCSTSFAPATNRLEWAW